MKTIFNNILVSILLISVSLKFVWNNINCKNLPYDKDELFQDCCFLTSQYKK